MVRLIVNLGKGIALLFLLFMLILTALIKEEPVEYYKYHEPSVITVEQLPPIRVENE